MSSNPYQSSSARQEERTGGGRGLWGCLIFGAVVGLLFGCLPMLWYFASARPVAPPRPPVKQSAPAAPTATPATEPATQPTFNERDAN